MAKVESHSDIGVVLHRRLCLFRRKPAQGPVGRLGATADWFGDLHLADDMVTWPRADEGAYGRKHHADGNFHQIGGK